MNNINLLINFVHRRYAVVFIRSLPPQTMHIIRACSRGYLRCQDTSDPGHFGTSDELSEHIGTSATLALVESCACVITYRKLRVGVGPLSLNLGMIFG